MARHPLPVALLIPALAVWVAGALDGCRRAPAEGAHATKPGTPRDSGIARLVDEAARARYAPPADGRLRASQVEMYIAVKRRGREIREAGLAEASRTARPPAATNGGDRLDLFATLKALGKADDAATAELRAARDLGANPKEYEWVKARVVEAEMAAARAKLETRLASGREQYIAMLETKMRQAKDPVLKADLEAQIADFRRRTRRAAPPPLPAAVAKNAELLLRYREGLDAAQAPATVPGILRATGERKEVWSRP